MNDSMRAKVISRFKECYDVMPQFLVRAPGRVNLIGEHTDYNDGFVMPFAIDRSLWMAVCPRERKTLCIHTLDYGDQGVSIQMDRLNDPDNPHWTQHVCGGWWLMAERERDLPGAEILIGSDIPIGAGLSSSAAIGVAVIETVLMILGEREHNQVEKALLAVEIEHRFIGVPCGVMDQIASAASSSGEAMLLDCRDLKTSPVFIPENLRIVVMDTGVRRILAHSAYTERREQCEQAASILGVGTLRDANLERIHEAREQLGDMRFRRARHVITENERTLKMQQTLSKSEVVVAGNLLNESHHSLKEDYEVSSPELDVMCEIARLQEGCFGARMMGGGFGGSAVALVESEHTETMIETVDPEYREKSGQEPQFYVCTPNAGSSVEMIS